MIDLHNHILPGVDDGASALQDSLDIAAQFVSEGVSRAAATPHVDPTRGTGPTRVQVEELVNRVQTALDGAGIHLQVETGCELYLTPQAPILIDDGTATTLGRGKAVLVECSFNDRPLYLEDTLFQLQLAGYRPVLAHPERYSYMRDDDTLVDSLVARDIVLQLTAPSLLGDYGGQIRRVSERLLRRGCYAVCASDRHMAGPRRSLAETHSRIGRLVSLEIADLLLCENPRRLLDDQPLMFPDARQADESGFFSRFLRK
jgi:protein-tyrosine phosphatase